MLNERWMQGCVHFASFYDAEYACDDLKSEGMGKHLDQESRGHCHTQTTPSDTHLCPAAPLIFLRVIFVHQAQLGEVVASSDDVQHAIHHPGAESTALHWEG